jgi:hypothetical protein
MRKKFVFAFFSVSMLWTSCSAPRSGPERIIENGIEVVVNGSEPYAVERQPRGLAIHDEFRIDLESEAVASLGLTDIWKIDLDPRGRIYIYRGGLGDGPLIFLFKEPGRFVRSFLRRGQGPGEVEFPRFLGMTPEGEIAVLDTGKQKVFFFSEEAILLREILFSPELRPVGRFGLSVLANGNFLAQYVSLGQDREIRKIAVLETAYFFLIGD